MVESSRKTHGTESFNSRGWDRTLWPVAQLAMSHRSLMFNSIAHIQKGERVIEIGAGVFPLFEAYSGKVGPDGIFIASDFDPVITRGSKDISDTINNVSNKLLGKKLATSQQITADAILLPFQDETFDLVIAGNFTGSTRYMKEAFRVLKPRGRLISTFWEPIFIPTSQFGDMKSMRKIGFEDVNLIPCTAGLLTMMNWAIKAYKPDIPIHNIEVKK